MTQPIRLSSLVAAPAAGFEEPFEMLEACHERIHRMLVLLARLRAHLAVHGADSQAQQAARDVLRYFDQAAPQHHRDEELHVFPPLLALGDERVSQVVARLRHDHVQMEVRWKAARAVLAAIADGSLIALDDTHHGVLDAFASLYGGHIEAEESIAYPRAVQIIGARQLHAMSRDMMARRGLVDPG